LIIHSPNQWGKTMAAIGYELKPGASWLAVTPSVIRYLWATGEAYAERDKKQPMAAFRFDVGTEHPVYDAMRDHLPQESKPYAWYIRVPDIVAFLQHIAPALEKRLPGSIVEGHTGELKLSFYRSGARLVFEQGRITTVEAWKPTPDAGGDAAFPNYTFLQLLFGYRTLDELRYAFADCWAGNSARALLEVLFPKRNSDIWPIA
jgi:hypothetical protein